ncbi:putative chemoreceptor glutamine deamidase CheD [Sulfidibacter corallicola]|uniref:Probable chemoreceptor glutamine deamidase CheD n=1 Tax=Sulfidibacter corallicola TaxID=2818388 RepID=A0A8A4TTE6_SULCO|nr:chemotaxis protein CheD [Sulfidibacter corallicola]QTD52763.1 chemotaxis protein CheD [Sulfidibacter corallicola]
MKENMHLVGLGGIYASKTAGETIKTMALGSCVGVIAVAPRLRAVGMVHIVLPDSKIDRQKAETVPGYFADSGIPALLDAFKKLGVKSPRELVIKLAGGAAVMKENNTFDIGKRNILACRKTLWKNHMAAIAEDVGGSFSRTVWVEVDTGRMFIQSPGRGRWEL